MNNFLKLISLIVFLGFASCGPSAEEKAAVNKHIEDSIAAAKVQMEAAREAARQQQIDDSTSAIDTVIQPAN